MLVYYIIKLTTHLFCSGCMTLPCFPIGSGLVMVVEKKPSHSTLPYRPAQLLCLKNIHIKYSFSIELIPKLMFFKMTDLLPV